MAYDADPAAFAAAYAEQEQLLTERIVDARQRVGTVELDDETLLSIAEICAAFDVDGMRGDLVTARAAIAHAAWHGRSRVTREDIRAAARLALPHRRRRNPFDAPGLDEELLEKLLGEDEPPPDGPGEGSEPEPGEAPPGGEEGFETGASTPSSTTDKEQTGAGAPAPTPSPSTVGAGDAYRARLFTVSGLGTGAAGKRSRAVTDSGRRIGARRPSGAGGSIHLLETIRAAAPQQRLRERTGPAIAFRADDLRVAVKEGKESNLVLFCVDASGSMAARSRMEQVKTAILSLLLDAYRRRDKVGLVTFRDRGATVALPPTSSIDIAATRLEELPAGGRTPLAEGLVAAAETLRVEAIRDPRRRPLLVVVTDGRATSGADALARSHQTARRLAATGVQALVVDCETGRFRLGLAAELADALGAEHLPIEEIRAADLTAAVRRHQPVRHPNEGAA
jgi:magnesium chelatase subunit D